MTIWLRSDHFAKQILQLNIMGIRRIHTVAVCVSNLADVAMSFRWYVALHSKTVTHSYASLDPRSTNTKSDVCTLAGCDGKLSLLSATRNNE